MKLFRTVLRRGIFLAIVVSMGLTPDTAGAFFLRGGSGVSVVQVARNFTSATRSPGYNGSAISNGTNTNQNGRAAFVNESGQSCSTAALIYSGWYTNTTNETDNANPYTVTASIEYPAGTLTQVLWSGVSSKSITAGSNIVSDYATVSIPSGAQFWVRTYVSVTAGQTWPTSGSVTGTELGEVGVGLSDKTMGGTITGTSAVLRPSAVISPCASGKTSLAVLGDSIAAGAGDGNYDSNGNTGGFNRAATGLSPVMSIAVTGTTVQNQVISGKMNRRIDLLQKAGVTHALTDWSVNDVGSRTAAQIQTDQLNLWNQLSTAGLKVVQTTLTPESTSADAWQTTTNQTPKANFSGSGSVRGLVNANIRTLPAPLYDYVEVANATETAQDSGIWGVGSTFNSHYSPVDSWTVGSGSTTTSVTSNSTRGTNYYSFGGAIVFTSGALNGTRVTVSSNTSGGTFTPSSTLASAPSSGDTFLAYPLSVAPTNDGTHPNVTGTNLGGHYLLKDVVAAKIPTWH